MDTEYTSFLIRLWRESPGTDKSSAPEWLVQVEHIPGGEKEYLASLEELFAFIRAQLPGSHAGADVEERAGRDAWWLRHRREE